MSHPSAPIAADYLVVGDIHTFTNLPIVRVERLTLFGCDIVRVHFAYYHDPIDYAPTDIVEAIPVYI